MAPPSNTNKTALMPKASAPFFWDSTWNSALGAWNSQAPKAVSAGSVFY